MQVLLPRSSILGMPVLSPFHPLMAGWTSWMTVVDLVYTAFWVPMGVAFCTERFGDLTDSCAAVDLGGGGVSRAGMGPDKNLSHMRSGHDSRVLLALPCHNCAAGIIYTINLLLCFQGGMVLRYHYKRIKVRQLWQPSSYAS
jgi:hypothetical protein